MWKRKCGLLTAGSEKTHKVGQGGDLHGSSQKAGVTPHLLSYGICEFCAETQLNAVDPLFNSF